MGDARAHVESGHAVRACVAGAGDRSRSECRESNSREVSSHAAARLTSLEGGFEPCAVTDGGVLGNRSDRNQLSARPEPNSAWF